LRSSACGQSKALRPTKPLSNSSLGSATRDGLFPGDGSDKSVDLPSLIHFGHAHQKTIFQLWVKRLQRNPRNDFRSGAAVEEKAYIGGAQYEFVKKRSP